MATHDIIVIGGSAGGVEGTISIASRLPADLEAAVFIVIHMAPDNRSYLPRLLQKASRVPTAEASDGEPVTPGRIYVARPNHHLLLERGKVRLTKGPKENRFRPAIDPLFRSAALAYGPRVIGVILSGYLDDGAAGLRAVKVRGGLTIVQDPREALVPSMPENALRRSRVDYQLRLTEIPDALTRLVDEPAADEADFPVSEGLETEARIAMEDNALAAGIQKIGEPSLFTCPECHGTLSHLKMSGGLRYRCHTGHAYTASTLLSELSDRTEESLWNAVRAVEESALLMQHLASHLRETGNARMASRYDSLAAEARNRAETVRRVILEEEPSNGAPYEEAPQSAPEARTS